MKYYTMRQKEYLDEALKTKKQITLEEFNELLPNYRLYSFDGRKNTIDFIANNLTQYTLEHKPEWLLIELDKSEVGRIN